MKYQLSQIFDIEELKKLCESFAQFSGIANAIIDLEGNIFVAAGWLPICTQFHQINKKTLNQCLESTTILAGPMHNGQKYNIYECKNGLMDIAIPIMVNHEHIGNFFLGQFLTKKPDIEFFKKQAKTYGFNESDYLSALEQVPVLSEEQIEKTNNFIMLLTETIGNLGLKNFQNLEYLKRLETGQQQLKEINEEIEQQNREIILSKAQAEESEEKYRLLHENAGIGIGYYSPEGIVISYNSFAAKNMDGVPEDFIGKSIFDIFPKPDAEFYFERIKKAIASDEIEIYEDFVQLPGTKKWFISTFTKILNSQGDLLGIQIISQDISALKNAESEAKQKKDFIENILNGISDAFFSMDDNLVVNYFNAAAEKMLHRKANEVIGKYLFDVFPEAKGSLFDEKYHEAVKEKIFIAFETFFDKPPYKNWYDVRIYPLSNGISVFFNVSTERKLAEESLAIKNAAIESAISAIGIADLEGNIIYANPAFVRLWGYSDVGEIIGKHISGFAVSKEQVSEVVRTLQAGSPYKGEGISLKMDGTTFHTSLTANLVTSADGKPVCMMASFLDITDRKRAEEELVEKNIELERQYEEYVQLNEVLRETNYGLEFAIKKAEESDRLKTAFLQNMSHEIRTPLNGILGFSHLLQADDISKEDIKEYTGIIQQSGNRLLNIINAVLDISKIETKQIAVSNKSFSLHSMLSDLYSFFTPIAAKKNLEMNYFIQRLNNNGLIDTDDIKLNQILTNLINNAIKFTQKGKIDFGYEVKGNCIEFFVRDTGIGISLEHQEKIFERFMQVDSKITKCFEGVGLGLAICKGLVELLGGSIWVVSEADKGSTFYFSIPYQPAIETEKIKPVEDKTIDFPRKTILIAEDDETSFAYLSKVLEKEQFNLLHAVNGEEAVQFVKNNPEIDFVLMDIRMPVMNGFEAAKLIKAMRPDLRIIAQTAYAFSQEREEILASGCDDYLSKPIDTLKLKKLLV